MELASTGNDSAKSPKDAQQPLGRFRSQWDMIWPWATLGLALMLTAAAYLVVKSDSEARAQENFDSRRDGIIEAIDQRLTAYTQALRGGLGLFKASEEVNRSEWRTYVETLNLNEIYPGIQGIGYSEWVLPENLAAYEARVRSEGFPDFAVHPAGGREVYSSIIYLEPFDRRNRQAFGYDMFSQETRRQAMAIARDTGKTAISGKVTLVQEITSDVQAGFLIYMPYYGRDPTPDTMEERRAASLGFIYSPFRMGDLMEGILGPGLPNVQLEIYDGDEIADEALMYASQQRSTVHSPRFVVTEPIEFGQHVWTARISSLPEFEKLLDPQKSNIVLVAGGLSSFLFFGVMLSIARTRLRAQQLAEKMTVALNERSEELARSNEDLEQFAYVASHDLKAPLRGIDNLAAWIEEDLGDKLDGEPRRNMRLLRRRVHRLETLLSDVLNYSRAHHADSPLETVNLEEVITTTWNLLNTGNRLRLELDIQMANRTVAIRLSALEQVLTNLFSNAVKHHDRDGGTVFVTVSEWPECYEFVVGDDGAGIPAEQHERAFQMFQTLRPRDEVEGSGMGLAIIRKLIERMGSSIEIEDRSAGPGVQFRFRWPKAGTAPPKHRLGIK